MITARAISLALALMLAAGLSACEDDGDGGDGPAQGGEGRELLDDGANDSRLGDDQDDPSGPGVEPPVTTDDMNTSTGGQPTAGSSDPTTGMPGNDGAAGQATPPPASMEDGDADAGTDDGYSCADFAVCGAGNACTGAGEHCIVLSFCGARPGCIDPEQACMIQCGTPSCALLESFPEQVRCN